MPRQFFLGPTKTLGQSGSAGARGVVMNKGGVSPHLESIRAMDHFIKLASITPALNTFKIILSQNSLSDSSECLK